MEKENWKNDVLRSLEGARRAEPGPWVYTRIRERIGQTAPVRAMRPVHPLYVALAAASLALLLTANVLALRQQSQVSNNPTVYQVDSANFNVYE